MIHPLSNRRDTSIYAVLSVTDIITIIIIIIIIITDPLGYIEVYTYSFVHLCIAEVSAEPQGAPFVDRPVIVVCRAARDQYDQEENKSQQCVA
jgi:hypothetical protein